jgi:putative glycosyltransferase (TIGR04372 family)
MRYIDKLRNKTKFWRFDPLVPLTHIYRAIRTLLKLALNVVYLIPATLFRLCNYRVPAFYTPRIGHLLLEPDCAFKEMRLGITPERKHIMLAPRRQVANQAAISYWKQYYTVCISPIASFLMRPLTWHPFTRLDVAKYAVATQRTAAFPRIQALWQGKPPLLKISEADSRRGGEFLRRIGVPADGWFVCVHSREGGYSPIDEHIQSYRNSPFDDYLVAIDYIISLGGICIRMGDPTMASIPEKRGLIGYAHHPDRSDWLDLYLSAKCRLFLGNSSGAFLMSSVFGVPVACANMAPLGSIFPFGGSDAGIPKLYKDASTGRLLPFSRILDLPMANFRNTLDFERQGIELVSNSPDEIRDLVAEQLQKVMDPHFSYSDEDEALQQRFRALFRPGHYTYGSASRIGRAFLQKYQNLLP